jgi:hypothetical protein
MAYELLNNGPAIPHRLHALVRLVARRPGIARAQLFDLLQPPSLMAGTSADPQNAAKVVLDSAIMTGLVSMDRSDRVILSVPQDSIEELAAFRQLMRERVLGMTDDGEPNYIFNLFAAWYAVLDEQVLTRPAEEITRSFNERVFPTADVRKMNQQKLAGWRPWAEFLGFGWGMSRGNQRFLVPDCTERIAPHLDRWLPNATQSLPLGEFMRAIGRDCPELDGGALFQYAQQAGRPTEDRGRRLSLMLSTALRGFHDRGICRLRPVADAAEVWTLFPATGHELQQVTHIDRGISHA